MVLVEAVTDASSLPFAGRPQGLIERETPGGARLLVLPTPTPGAVASGPGRTGRRAGAGPTPAAGVVAVQLWVLSGTAAERPSEHGCAHLLEHMLFKPDPEDPAAGDIATAVEALGGDVNAFTSHDETVFHATVPATAALPCIDALLRPIVAPRFDPEVLAREADVVVEEIHQHDDDPASRTVQALMERLFTSHAYGRSVTGTAVEVLAHRPGRLRGFHRRAYAADRVRLIVVGPVDPAAVEATARPWLRRLPAGGRRGVAEVRATPPGRGGAEVSRQDVHEAQLHVGWVGPPLPEPDAVALEVASVVLGYGEASRLTAQLRRGEGLVSDAHASFFGSRLASTMLVSGHGEGLVAGQAAEAVLSMVEQLGTVPIEEEELARARAVLESDLIYRRETAQGQAHALGYLLSLAGDLDADRRYYEALSSLTARDVREACRRHLAPVRAHVGVVVPKRAVTAAEARRMRTRLARCVAPARKARAKATHAPRLRRRGGVSCIDLPCGVRVRAVVDPSLPVCAGWLVWPGGLRLENAKTQGRGPLVAELLTRGCDAIEGDALAREIEGYAAVLDGFAGRNSAGLHFESLAPHLPTVLRRALQCAVAPTFDEPEVAREIRLAIASCKAEADDLGWLAVADALRGRYGRHPYGLRARGTPESLAGLTAVGLRRSWRRNHPLGRMVLGLAGDVDLEGAAGLVESIVGPVAAARGEGAVSPMPSWPGRAAAVGRGRRLERAGSDKEQVHLAIAYPGLAIPDPRTPVLEVLVAILGGQAGRLFLRLREELGLVYHVSATSTEGIDGGDVVVYAACGQAKRADAEAAIDEEIRRLRTEGVTASELTRAQAWVCGQFEAAWERRGRLASLVAFDEAFGLPVGACFGYRRRIEAVRPAAILELARELLDPARRVTAVAG